MVFDRKNKSPFILFFTLNLIKFQLIWISATIFVAYVLYCCKGGEWDILRYVLSWIKDMPFVCCFGIMPVIAPALYYYQCFSMVDKITINEKEKVLQIDYRPFFFWNKTRSYQLDNTNFCCEISTGKLNFFTKVFLPHCSTILTLYYSTEDNRLPTYLKDTCGWQREKIMDVYQELKKYNHSDDFLSTKTDS